MTKINIFSGFLGAGKTSLIKKLIAEAFHDKIVLIENEFGDISVDGGFLKDAGVEMREINSGCICCSLVGDFEAALHQAIDTYHPSRIIIEPSGVGKLSDVKRAVSAICDDEIVIEGSITVVHAGKAKMYARNFGEFFSDQVASADCIVLSRTQDVSKKKLDETLACIRELNEKAPVVTTPWEEISGEKILEALSRSELLSLEDVAHHHEHHHHEEEGHDEHEHHHDESCHHDHHHHDEDGEHEHHHHHDHDHECDDPNCSCHDHHHHHHADEVFTSWGRETADKYTREQLEAIIAALKDEQTYGLVLRAKGILAGAEGSKWLAFNYVPGEGSVEESPADYTGRFCVIGSKLNEEALAKLFAAK